MNIRPGWKQTCFIVVAATAMLAPTQWLLAQSAAQQNQAGQQPRLLSQRISGQRIGSATAQPSVDPNAPPAAETNVVRPNVVRPNVGGAVRWGSLANKQSEGKIRNFTPRHLRNRSNVVQTAFTDAPMQYTAHSNLSPGSGVPAPVAQSAPVPGSVDQGFIQPGGCSCGNCNQGMAGGPMGCDSCGDMGCASCGPVGCDSCGGVGCASCGIEPGCGCGAAGYGRMHRREFNPCPFPTPWCRWRDLETGFGVHGFKNALNLGMDASFGFHEWFNFGFAAPCMPLGVSGQFGVQVTQSNFYGASFTNSSRHQLFFTGGLFRRADWGLQAGAVVDYMYESWYVTTRLAQVRAEVSWAYPSGTDIGVWTTRSLTRDNNTATFAFVPRTLNQNQALSWETSDVYAFFIRRQTQSLAEGRFMAGFTDQSHFMIGGDFSMPLTPNLGLGASAIMFLPDSARGDFNGVRDEDWNLRLNVIYYPGGWGRVRKSYNRPLLPVAGNDNFFITRTSP